MVYVGTTMNGLDEISSAETAIVAQHTTHRAIEICGMLCPDCCLDEERPGRCINPRGHQDEHYCGKCGYCEEGSNGNIWAALGHAGAVAMFDTSSHHADIAECPPVAALSHAGPAAAEDRPAGITVEPPVPNQTVALTSNALDAFLDKWV